MMMTCCCLNDEGQAELKVEPSIGDEAAVVPRHQEDLEPILEEPVTVGCFEVIVPTEGYRALGLEVDTTATVKAQGGLMVKGINDGAVKAFNNRYPAQAIQLYDELTLLDQATSSKEIKSKLGSSKLPAMLKIGLDRPRAVQVTLVKPGMLGIKLDFKATSAGCVVEEVLPEGLVTKWNATRPESERVRKGDRVVKINGEPYLGSKMLEVMKQEDRLDLTVLKYSSSA